jgi:predicted MFS family arabinose efflux permease
MTEQIDTLPLPDAGQGRAALFMGKNAIFTVVLCGSVVLQATNIFITITILPSIVSDIGGLEYYAWNTSLFAMASILGAALSSRLFSRAGARGAYFIAALVFAVGALTCAFAPNMPTLLVGRFIQGWGGGLLFALAYSVVRFVFPEALIGPTVGSVFAEFGVWRAAFLSLIPFLTFIGAVALIFLPKVSSENRKSGPIPYLQLFLISTAVLAVSAGSSSPLIGWNIAGMVCAIALVAALGVAESSSRKRLLPTGALNIATPAGAIFGTMALLVISMQPETFVPYLLQTLHERSPLVAGYLAALMAGGWTLASLGTAKLDGSKAKLAIKGAPYIGFAGLVLLLLFMPIRTSGDWLALAPMCVGLLLVGGSIGLAWPHLLTRVFQSTSEDEQIIAASAITAVQLFATALGAAAAGMIANIAGIASGNAEGAADAATWIFLSFSVAPVLAIFAAIRAVR